MKLAARHLQRLRGFSARSTEATFYEEAYAQVRKSYSGFAKNLDLQRLAYLPPHDVNAVIPDPIRYLGGFIAYTLRGVDIDEFTGQLLSLAECLAVRHRKRPTMRRLPLTPTCPWKHSQSRNMALPKSSGSRGTRYMHSLSFDLDCGPETRELRLRFDCDPGMVEISHLTLIHDGGPERERTYEGDELKTKLLVVSNGATVHSGHAHWLLISSASVLMTFRDWRNEDDAPLKSLRLKLRFENRLLEGVFLHPNALNEITRESD